MITDNTVSEPETKSDTVREVVGVFRTASALDTAVEQLEFAGVGRAAISVLGVDAERSGRVDTLYQSAEMIEDDPTIRLATFVSPHSRAEGEAAAVAVPFAIGGFAGAWAVAAAGGALITAIGVTVLSGGVAAGLGALLLRAVAHHHAMAIETQLAHGGLILWVRTPDSASEERALSVLRSNGGTSVHAHTIERSWGVADTPLHDVQPDLFLETKHQ
jgi:hypothetical protein